MPHPQPYRSLKPWTGFTAREKKRAKALSKCPSPACRRAKACIRAIDDLYCQRTHVAPTKPKRRKFITQTPLLAARPEQAALLRAAFEMRVARYDAYHEAMTERWKAGELNHHYGPFNPKGVWMRPPPRDYVEL